ncbi:MAG: dTDP-glucose 4,6-dehydratase [Saprospiraceae bacterium]
MQSILITGGAGFIGSHLVRHFVNKYSKDYRIINLDKLTYAGNLENLKDIENQSNYIFEKGDIQDFDFIDILFNKYNIQSVIHLAAESHVDRSIENPIEFVNTNVIGTLNLLNAAKKYWQDEGKHVFYHVSTDEVYGSLGSRGKFKESTKYDPRSPYSAAKASSDHFVRAFYHTYNLPFILSNCSNNYGPFQFPEKLIPLIINNIINNKELPVYGDGKNVRDWLYVEDHVKAIDLIFHNGIIGETYNIGGDTERQNIEIVNVLCDIVDAKLKREDTSKKLIKYIKDRPGHDRRYAIDSSKLQSELGWKPETDFNTGMKKTVEWYLDNVEWLSNVTSGEYLNYYNRHYK